MKKKMNKKFLTSFLTFSIMFFTLFGSFNNIGNVVLSATSVEETNIDDDTVSQDTTLGDTTTIDLTSNIDSPDNVVTSETTTEDDATDISKTDEAIIQETPPTDNATNPDSSDDLLNTPEDIALDGQESSTDTDVSTLATTTCTPSNPDDITDPLFKKPTVDAFIPIGFDLDLTHYDPNSYTYTDMFGDVYHIPGAATDTDAKIKYSFIYDGPGSNGFKGDGTDAPGIYTVYVRATDTSCNSTGVTNSATGAVDNPDQILYVHVVDNPTLKASQDGNSTRVNLEFSYDENLLSPPVQYYLFVYGTPIGTDVIILPPGTTTYTYDQGNYEDYEYELGIFLGQDYVLASEIVNMIDPTANDPDTLAYTGLENSTFENFILFLQDFLNGFFI